MNNLKSNLVQHKDFKPCEQTFGVENWPFWCTSPIQLGHFGPPILQFQTDHIGIVVYFHIPTSAPALYQEEFSATHLVTIPDEGDHSIIEMLQ